MTHLLVVLFVGLFLFIFGVVVLAFAIAIGGMLVMRLIVTIHDPWKFTGSLIATALFGSFAFIFGRGAYLLASDIVNGFIGRFLV